MAFSTIMQNQKSVVFAQTMVNSEIIFIPAIKLIKLVRKGAVDFSKHSGDYYF